MHRHLVTIEIGIKCCTNQRMQLNRLSFNQDGFKCLYAESVKGRRSIQQDTVLLDNLVQAVPYLRRLFFHEFLSLLQGGGQAFFLQLVVDEGFEEFQGHHFRESALVEPQVRTHHNH